MQWCRKVEKGKQGRRKKKMSSMRIVNNAGYYGQHRILWTVQDTMLSQTLREIIKHEGICGLILENHYEWSRKEEKLKGKKDVQRQMLPISSLTCEFPGFLQFVEKATLNKILVKSPRK